MTDALLSVHGVVWGVPMLALILGVGIRIAGSTAFVQLRLLPEALASLFRNLRRTDRSGGVSPFRALCTALGATVGTGNIVGVAGAICLGGPGAVFWMWLCGLLAMGTKFAEAVLAVRFCRRTGGEQIGGPMYIILDGMGSRWKWLAAVYCCLGLAASFGVGNATQINAVIAGLNSVSGGLSVRQCLGVGLILAVLVGTVLLGGAKRIGAAAELLIPAASGAYILLCILVLLFRMDRLPMAFRAIVEGAFSPQAMTGGLVGSMVQALRVGCARGVFTNEAGMGTASMAHACADVAHPVEQGLLGIFEVFLDTLVLCTLTALVILVSGVTIPYGADVGGELTLCAFSSVCGGWVCWILAAALCCFAFGSILGWGLYGARCVQFLFGQKGWEGFALLQSAAVVMGAVLNTEWIWLFSEIMNGLMAVPNLIALAVLTPEVRRLTNEYKNKSGSLAADGGHYANFNQCQPLRTLSHEKIPSLRCGSGKGGQKDLSSEHRSA